MTVLNVVAKDDLCPLVTLLRDIPKPIPYTEYPAIFEQLGWVNSRRRGGRSNFAISFPDASVTEQRGNVSKFRAYVSDSLDPNDPNAPQAVRDAFPEVKQSVTDCIGFEPTGTPLHYEGADWELEDGSVIRLHMGEIVIELVFLSKLLADVERYERRHGIDLDQPMEEIDA